ncbi:unannotated protein [freshwater metagenome]|uniref:Unannotated protein n=1 Tax=freshwater metagenome TaxID=449393 RepID=A0A6J6DYW7_9ZZZZ
MALKKFPVDAGLIVVALKKCQARQFDEIAITLIVFSQQSEVVVLLASALVGPAIVVHASTTWNALGAMIMGHVGLGTQDGFDSLLLTFLVEVDNAVHISVVCDPQRGLTIFNCFADEFIEACRAIEHGIFGMNVEVCKR